MNRTKQKVLFVWDFHGVLEKDNEYAVAAICKTVLKEFGYNTPVLMRDVRLWYGLRWLEYFMLLTGEKDKKKLRAMAHRAPDISREIVHKYLKPMGHARYVLSRIKKSGGVNIIISNSRQDRIEQFLQLVKLDRYMDHIIGIDGHHTKFTFSAPKEKAKVIQQLAKQRKFSKIIMIGDSETDVKAGKIAGAKTYMFVTRLNKEKAKNTKADYVISDLRKVLVETKMH